MNKVLVHVISGIVAGLTIPVWGPIVTTVTTIENIRKEKTEQNTVNNGEYEIVDEPKN